MEKRVDIREKKPPSFALSGYNTDDPKFGFDNHHLYAYLQKDSICLGEKKVELSGEIS